MHRDSTLLEELKRRKVVRAAVVFAFHAAEFASIKDEPRFLALAARVGVPMGAPTP